MTSGQRQNLVRFCFVFLVLCRPIRESFCALQNNHCYFFPRSLSNSPARRSTKFSSWKLVPQARSHTPLLRLLQFFRRKPLLREFACSPLLLSSKIDNGRNESDQGDVTSDEELLESIDISTLQGLCKQYSLSTSGSKPQLLQRLRGFANQQAELDLRRRQGKAARIEAGSEGKARHTILGEISDDNDYDDDDELQGYFYFAAVETTKEKKQRESEKQLQKQKQKFVSSSRSRVTAPPIPGDIQPNEKGERCVTIYSTTDRNDMTGGTSPSPFSQADAPMVGNGYQRYSDAQDFEGSLVAGPFGDDSMKRKKVDAGEMEKAKDQIHELVKNLLATTGAPAFQDDFLGEDCDSENRGVNEQMVPGARLGVFPLSNSFTSPYGFIGFEPDRISPDLLSQCSEALRIQNGQALKEVISEYELQAIGHDGMAADDKSSGGGHYREVEKVGSFLEGFRKAEEKRIARGTATLLLDCLVKEGVAGLDRMMTCMMREGSTASIRGKSDGVGELNDALLRYLNNAIWEQEKYVKKETLSREDELKSSSFVSDEGESKDDELDTVWNVTRGKDGVLIESLDPNDPLVNKVFQEELLKMKNQTKTNGIEQNYLKLSTMTVQEKLLLLLTLLRDRVQVEAVIGDKAHAKNLRVLAYCLKLNSDQERQQLILEELGTSLDKLEMFDDLISGSIGYAMERSNDFMPSKSKHQTTTMPLLDVLKLQKIKAIVEGIKAGNSWKASGLSSFRP